MLVWTLLLLGDWFQDVEEMAIVQYPEASGSKGISSTMLDVGLVALYDTAIRDNRAGYARATVVPIPRQPVSSGFLEEIHAIRRAVCL